MSIRGTENYVFYVEQKLGAGSTGTVFYGRHKRKGDPCACKLFTRQDSASKTSVKDNELAYMRQLQHPNIVQCLAIEEDTRTKETVLVMELCSEGSLQKILGEPENVFGLAEESFVDFFSQFVDGLNYLVLHGIAHRDIKPGNILCCKSEEGRTIYKLTDFGATRELATSNAANPLYGTEEYLHPEVYRRVLIAKVEVGSDYETNAEIWSIGVTLFHIATGQLPFQVHGGRNNRPKMYQIISQKKRGDISGIQSTINGVVIYQDKLPVTCALSTILQEKVVNILANTLEINQDQQWKFEDLFPFCKTMMKNKSVVVFHAASCVYHRVYVPGDSKLLAVRNELVRVTKIALENQILMYGTRFIHDTDSTSNSIEAFPTSEENPIVLLSNSAKYWQKHKFITPALPTKPVDDDSSNLTADSVWSRGASAACYRSMILSKVLVNYQLLFEAFKQNSTNCFITRSKDNIEVFNNLKEIVHATQSNINLSELENQRIIKFSEDSVEISGPNEQRATLLRQRADTLHVQFAQFMTSSRSSHRIVTSKMEEVEALFTQLQNNLPKQILLSPFVSVCQEKRCNVKFRQRYNRSHEINAQFIVDKNREMSYNDDQIHKYDRMKLTELLDDVINDVRGHCVTSTEQEHAKFRKWFGDWFLPRYRDLENVEKYMKELRVEVTRQTEELKKIVVDINDVRKQYTELLAASASDSAVPTVPTSGAKPGFVKKIFSSLLWSGHSKTSSSGNTEEPTHKPHATSGAGETKQFKIADNVSAEVSHDSLFETASIKDLVREMSSVMQSTQPYMEQIRQDSLKTIEY